MKRITTTLIILLFSAASFAASNTAQQAVNLQLMPIIEIGTSNKNTSNNNDVNLRVKSNKEFKVTVTAAKESKVQIAVTESAAMAMVNNNVAADSTMKELVKSCCGGTQSFAVNYTTKTDAAVVYTATHP